MKETEPFSKGSMYSFYLDDPKDGMIERQLNDTKIQYLYFDEDLDVLTKPNEVINGCILSGYAKIIHKGEEYEFNQFDFFFLPPGSSLTISVDSKAKVKNKICLYYSPAKENINLTFDIQHYSKEKFIPRGEPGSDKKMSTKRTVWTAIKNGYFMSGFTNIPNESIKQGVITSVNLEQDEVYPHIHPDNPEVYIMCIDDENYAISQYLINIKGETVVRDCTDGEGAFFPGSLGHSNFARPFYKELEYCMYYWCIPTMGLTDTIIPITLRN